MCLTSKNSCLNTDPPSPQHTHTHTNSVNPQTQEGAVRRSQVGGVWGQLGLLLVTPMHTSDRKVGSQEGGNGGSKKRTTVRGGKRERKDGGVEREREREREKREREESCGRPVAAQPGHARFRVRVRDVCRVHTCILSHSTHTHHSDKHLVGQTADIPSTSSSLSLTHTHTHHVLSGTPTVLWVKHREWRWQKQMSGGESERGYRLSARYKAH